MGTELVAANAVRLVPRQLAGDLEAWGVQVVSLVEQVRLWIFRRSLALFMLVTLLSAMALPYRQAVSGDALARALIVAGAVAGATLVVLVCSRAAYRLLSGNRVAQGALVLVAAALVSAVFPLHSQLWLPACGVLCLLAFFVPLREIVVADLLVLIANLVAHAIGGDLGDVRPVAVIGLWVGIPFWTILFSIANEKVVDHILDLCLRQPVPHASPLHVDAWVARSYEALPGVRRVAGRLTPKQKQAMLLLAVGSHNYEIAQRLGIKPRAVSGLISRSLKQTGAESKEELSAMLAREWWDTWPAVRAREYKPDFG
jgi:DNA-binding CsgD family transcriptional regulator